MNVLLLNHTFRDTDGQGRVNARIAAALLRAGHRVTLVGREVPGELAGHGLCEVVELGPGRWPTALLRNLSFGWRSARLIRRRRAEHDLVIVNGGMTFEPGDLNVCHFVHAHWINSAFHPRRQRGGAWGMYQYLYSRVAVAWEKRAYRAARGVVAISALVRDQLTNDCGVDPAKVLLIHNGLDAPPESVPPEDSDRAESADARARLRGLADVPEGAFVVFFAGELRTPRKNLEVLLRAMDRLPAEVHLVAAGGTDGGPYPQEVRRRGLQGRVHLLGHREDVRSLYAGADCFAFLSHYDPFALVVTEAMAAGRPVITARTVGAAEVVERAGCGVVLEDATDDAAVAREIRRLKGDDAWRQQLGAASTRAAEGLAWDKVGQRYVALCERLAL